MDIGIFIFFGNINYYRLWRLVNNVRLFGRSDLFVVLMYYWFVNFVDNVRDDICKSCVFI